MSGGSFDYICYTLERECTGEMHDAEMEDLLKDFIKVLHDLEWWQSGDISEEVYRETVAKFKKKWFDANREERLKGYVDEHIAAMRKELYDLLGVEEGEIEAKVKELEDAIAKCEQAEKEFKSRTCNFRGPINCDFCSFHSDCDERW